MHILCGHTISIIEILIHNIILSCEKLIPNCKWGIL